MILDYRKRPLGAIEKRYLNGKVFLDGEEVHEVVRIEIYRDIPADPDAEIEPISEHVYATTKTAGDGVLLTYDLEPHSALIGVKPGPYGTRALLDFVPSGRLTDLPNDIGICAGGGPLSWERCGYIEIFTAAEFEELCRSGARKVTVDLVDITTIGDEWRQLRPGKLRLEPITAAEITPTRD